MTARSFNHTFKIPGESYQPGADPARLVLWAILESARQELLTLQTDGVNQSFDDMFIAEADEDRLDAWGEVFDLPREEAESDADYRDRLLTKKQSRGYTKTVQVLQDTVDALGAGFDPAMTVLAVTEKYTFAWYWKDGVPWYDTDLCPMWADKRDLWAVYIVLSALLRTPRRKLWLKDCGRSRRPSR